MRTIILAALLLAATSASAQQATPNEQAMGQKLMQEIQAGLNCTAGLITVQADLGKAQARIKELEAKDKPEPKK